jgi:REP element-mobilizing transposase RayT
MKALAIGGAADHVHILLSLPATMSVASDIGHIA